MPSELEAVSETEADLISELSRLTRHEEVVRSRATAAVTA